jgi:hypothetical protein
MSVNSYRPPCISHSPVRNAHGVPTSIRASRESIHPGKLLKELGTDSRVSVVFTVSGPLVYQRRSDQFA